MGEKRSTVFSMSVQTEGERCGAYRAEFAKMDCNGVSTYIHAHMHPHEGRED